MLPVLLLCSSVTGLALGSARLKVWALIPATIIYSLIAALGGIGFGLHWGMVVLVVIANATILQSSYVIAGLVSEALLSETPSRRVAARKILRPDLVRIAQFAIGEELRAYLQRPHDLTGQLRIRVQQLAIRYG